MNLQDFLKEEGLNGSFPSALSLRGGYITFRNSGRRGSCKYFQIGLDSVITTLKDIKSRIVNFNAIEDYDEKAWRDNGAEFYSDEVANAMSTVQTKPLFSTLSKIIKWANPELYINIDPDQKIVLTDESLSKAIEKLDSVAESYKPIILNRDNNVNLLIQKELTDYTEKQLGEILKGMYNSAGANRQVVSIYLFGIKYGDLIKRNNYKAASIISESGISSSYSTELSKAINLQNAISENLYGVSFLQLDIIDRSVNNNMNIQQIFYGAPGTGKSYIINEETKNKSVIRTTFHPDSDYSTFVGSYKPTAKLVQMYSTYGDKATLLKDEQGEAILENKIVYEFVPQAFLKAYTNAWKLIAGAETFDNAELQFLIIEEINRGNCAQIFGDLFQLLDRNEYGLSDYAIHSDNDLKKYLEHEFKGLTIRNKEQIDNIYDVSDITNKVLTGEILLLPSNLYIWATMNTSDQSLFPIDSAFKRRWDWQYMSIKDEKKGFIIEIDGNQYDWWTFITNINVKIDQITGSEDKKLGYWFAKPRGNNTVINCDQFVSKVLFYLWNDIYKDYADDIRSIFRCKEGADSYKISFTDFFVADSNRKFDEDKLFKFMEYNEITRIKIAEDSEST